MPWSDTNGDDLIQCYVNLNCMLDSSMILMILFIYAEIGIDNK